MQADSGQYLSVSMTQWAIADSAAKSSFTYSTLLYVSMPCSPVQLLMMYVSPLKRVTRLLQHTGRGTSPAYRKQCLEALPLLACCLATQIWKGGILGQAKLLSRAVLAFRLSRLKS